jgi:hypothetical protein
MPGAGGWRTIVPEKYSFSCNGGEEYSVDDMLRMGTYNALIGETAYYSSKNTGTSCFISTYCKHQQCLHIEARHSQGSHWRDCSLLLQEQRYKLHHQHLLPE